MSLSEITCPECSTTLQLPPDSTASRFRCTQCHTVFGRTAPPAPPPPAPVAAKAPEPAFEPSPFALPDPDDAPRSTKSRKRRDEEEEDAPRPSSRKRRDEDEEEPRSSRARKKRDEEDEDEPADRRPSYSRPGSRREPASKMPLFLAAGGGMLLLVGLGVGAYFLTREKPKETVKADPTPAKPAAKPAPKVEPLTPEQMIRKVKTSTVYIRTHDRSGGLSSGTGFFAGKPGYVVTNAHVVGYGPAKISPPAKVEVVIDSGGDSERTFPAKVFGVDALHDLAVLRVEAPSLPVPLAFGKSEELIETQEVTAFGYPFGEQLGKNVSINPTRVSSLRRANGTVDVVQLAGGLNPGNSGGPVVNAKGEVIGVSVSKLKGTDNIAFAIPAETAYRFVDDQIACGGQIRLGGFAGEKADPNAMPPE